MYFVYLVECSDKSIYTGITTDLARRFSEHRNKKGGRYTASHIVKKVIYSEQFGTRSDASKREAEIKKWPHAGKLRLAGAFKTVKSQIRQSHSKKPDSQGLSGEQ